MTPDLQRYTIADAAACHRVFYRAVHIGAAPFYAKHERNAWAPIENMPETWPRKLAAQACWVARVDGDIVGFFSLESDGHLDMAFVSPEFRRSLVAPELYDKILQDAKRLELSRLFTEASHLALGFFEKRGWVVTQPETVTRNAVEIERFQMALDLP